MNIILFAEDLCARSIARIHGCQENLRKRALKNTKNFINGTYSFFSLLCIQLL